MEKQHNHDSPCSANMGNESTCEARARRAFAVGTGGTEPHSVQTWPGCTPPTPDKGVGGPARKHALHRRKEKKKVPVAFEKGATALMSTPRAGALSTHHWGASEVKPNRSSASSRAGGHRPPFRPAVVCA